MVLKLLKVVLIADGVVLLALGVPMLIAPHALWSLLGFTNLPPAVNYIVGMWGALLATMGLGYFFAARDPATSHAWVWVGLIRGVLEVAASLGYMFAGLVSFGQAWLGLVLAAWFALAYVVFYPRASWIAEARAGQPGAARAR